MDEWAPVQGRDPFAALPSYDDVRRPSIEGRDALRYAMSELAPYDKPVKKHRFRWPRWLTWKRTVALLIVDLILGNILWHHLFAANPGAAKGAVNTTLNDVRHHDWSGVYNSLCRDDRAQINESDLASEGTAALAQFGIGGLARWTETSATTVHQSLGPVNLPAVQVSGELFPVAGQSSPYKVVAVHELTGWRVCMSAGGFEMLGYTQPLGEGFTP